MRSGGCTFPDSWTGSWFQSGIPGLIAINATHIQSKGECSETESYDKFLLYDRSEDCYRCMVIHEKHRYVLQYKETYCSSKESLSSLCESITGDAALYSMFRKEPTPQPQACPFRPAPFTFTYNRGAGDCTYPPSRAESCTDDSRLLLRYMACPDVQATESNGKKINIIYMEELVCLATWKEGSTRYLVGKISQVQRRNAVASDEDTYRCFIYKGQHSDKSMTYYIAQSGDATCNGLSSPTDGSRTMRLTNSDDEHNRCHFPSWIVEHHKWFSLDHTHQYHFTTKNATLKIANADGHLEEKRLVCHSILEQKDKKHIKLIAHVTKGCESGHVCLVFHRRSANVLELRSGASLWESPQDACAEPERPPYITLITTNLSPERCPIFGRYSVVSSLADSRRRRQQMTIGEDDTEVGAAECVPGLYDSASIGCGAGQDTIEFKSACASTAAKKGVQIVPPSTPGSATPPNSILWYPVCGCFSPPIGFHTVYTCYGSWTSNGAGYVVAAPQQPRAARPRTACLVYEHHANNVWSALVPSSVTEDELATVWWRHQRHLVCPAARRAPAHRMSRVIQIQIKSKFFVLRDRASHRKDLSAVRNWNTIQAGLEEGTADHILLNCPMRTVPLYNILPPVFPNPPTSKPSYFMPPPTRKSLTYTRGASPTLSLSVVSHSCDRAALPGQPPDKAYNLTINGKKEIQEKNYTKYNARASRAANTTASRTVSLLRWLSSSLSLSQSDDKTAPAP
ncbi:hypothetical protein MSG28_015404 [Choristoneura fumiferana]|uniref:Uncharacterized protein n=1 Tax=Choristoneura fumiferana TaxID=7141 RepID=A0ACC0KA85_CHOFU|nr:hypothetical protein MSG28_015404 [Choristoneura fumiferana]